MEKCNPIKMTVDGSAEDADRIPVVIIEHLPDSQINCFRAWLKGQTIVKVQGYDAAYAWDYEDWFRKQKDLEE
mgnify:CR=1 FL=1